MKKHIVVAITLLFLGGISVGVHAVERFYGTITHVDSQQQTITVHNKKRNENGQFAWTDQTKIVQNKLPVTDKELKAGQFLMVSYETIGNTQQATKLSLREKPGRKKPVQP